MRSVVLVHTDGIRVELYIEGTRVDWVHLHRRLPPRREQMIYERPEDLERALLVRFGELTTSGFVVADVPPRAHAATAVPPDALERGIQPFWVGKAGGGTQTRTSHAALEATTLVAIAPSDQQQAITRHIPALHGFVVGMGCHTLVLDGNPGRHLRSIVPEATGTPPHREWLRAWLDTVHATPGPLRTLVFRNCRLFDFNSAELAARLDRCEQLAFVTGFPRDLSCAKHARALTLGVHDPDAELPDTALDALATADLAIERLEIENAIEKQPIAPKVVDSLARASLPQLRELAVAGISPTSFIARLVNAPLLERLRVVRLDARFYPGDLDYLRTQAAALRHLERFELGLLPGSVTDDLAALQQELPNTVELVDAVPVCPY